MKKAVILLSRFMLAMLVSRHVSETYIAADGEELGTAVYLIRTGRLSLTRGRHVGGKDPKPILEWPPLATRFPVWLPLHKI